MANWNAPTPKENNSPRENANFLREIWQRIRFFPVTFPTGNTVNPGTTSAFTTTYIGLTAGMAVKMCPPTTATLPPPTGFTWDCAVQANDLLTMWFSNTNAAPFDVYDGAWSIMGVVL